MSEPERAPSTAFLDIFRGTACLYVVIHHCIFSLFAPGEGEGWAMKAFLTVFSNAHIALVIFIILSGFCLGLPVARSGGEMPESYGRFLARRAVRLLPPYWLALGLGAWMGSTVIATQMGTWREWDNSVPFNSTAVWLHLFLLEDLWEPYTDKINHPLWSVAVETHIYLFFPVFVLLLRRLRPLWATSAVMLFAALLWGGLYMLHVRYWPEINLGPSGVSPHFFVLFFFGYLLSQQTAAIRRGDRHVMWRLTMGWLLMSVAATFVAQRLAPETEALGRFMLRDLAKAGGVCIVLMLMLRHIQGDRFDRWRLGRAAAMLGTMSYSIYLVHGPIVEWVMRLEGAYAGSTPWRLWVAVVVAPAVSLLVGLIFYRLVERPSHTMAARLRKPGARPSPDAVAA